MMTAERKMHDRATAEGRHGGGRRTVSGALAELAMIAVSPAHDGAVE